MISIEDITTSLQLVKRYEKYRLTKLWGKTVLTYSMVMILLTCFSLVLNILQDFGVITQMKLEYLNFLSNIGWLILSFSAPIVFFILIYFFSSRKTEIKQDGITSSYYIYYALALFSFFFFILRMYSIVDWFIWILRSDDYFYLSHFFNPIFPNLQIEVYWGHILGIMLCYILLRVSLDKEKFLEILLLFFFYGFSYLSLYLVDRIFYYTNPTWFDGNSTYISLCFRLLQYLVLPLVGYTAIKRADNLLQSGKGLGEKKERINHAD